MSNWSSLPPSTSLSRERCKSRPRRKSLKEGEESRFVILRDLLAWAGANLTPNGLRLLGKVLDNEADSIDLLTFRRLASKIPDDLRRRANVLELEAPYGWKIEQN